MSAVTDPLHKIEERAAAAGSDVSRIMSAPHTAHTRMLHVCVCVCVSLSHSFIAHSRIVGNT